MSRPRVIVVAKKSAVSRVHGGEADARARTLLESGHASVRKWLPAHEQHTRTVDLVYETLESLGVKTLLLHGAQAEFDPMGASLIVTVGGDGTLLAASHHVRDVPLLGVNSAPRYSVGFFCAARGKAVPRMLARALEGRLPSVQLNRMAVSINGQRRSSRVLNEALFCHAEPAATSSYILKAKGHQEEQRSSGFWIGPAAGSTAAMHSAGGRILPLASKKLQVVVREPLVRRGHPLRMARTLVEDGLGISAVSKMERACVFLDGPYRQLSVRLGDEVHFEGSDEPLTLLGLAKRRRE